MIKKKLVHVNAKNLKMIDKWIRLFFMILFAVINYFVRLAIFSIAAFQFFVVLFTNKPNDNLINLGGGLSAYSYRILLFLTYNTEEKPFPFTSWSDTIGQ